MILAPLRGVTIRCFRETFAEVIANAGFTEAITPFIPAMAGVNPLKSDELKGERGRIKITPQFISKDPYALKECLRQVKQAGYDTADLNCGCPFPMVRNKGRGSGLLKTPEVLRQLLEVGCEIMGAGKFSVKARIGVESKLELLSLMPIINNYPLRFLTVHGRIARQMYEGRCDLEAVEAIEAVAKVPIVRNGDLPFPSEGMIGRGFVRYLGGRDDAQDLARRYIDASRAELFGDRPVLGRMKELIAYWKELPQWSRKWRLIKICRSVDELCAII